MFYYVLVYICWYDVKRIFYTFVPKERENMQQKDVQICDLLKK